MYAKQRFFAQNFVTADTMITVSSQATGRVSGVSTNASGAAVWTSSGAYSGTRDLLVSLEIDDTSAGGEIGEATFSWKTSDTTTGWEATGVTTASTAITLGSDGKKIVFTGGTGDDFVTGDTGTFWCYASFGAGKLLDLDRNTYWQSTGDSSETLIIDLGSAQAITAFLIGDHNLTSGATVTLQGNTSNAWGSPAYSQAVTVQDPAYLYLSQTYRYWRVVLADAANPSGYLRIGELYIGTYTELASNFARTLWGSDLSRSLNTVDNRSETGRTSSRLWSSQQKFILNYQTLDLTDRNTLKTIWEGTFNLESGVMTPLWIHYFYDEADLIMLCDCVSGFETKFRSFGIYEVKLSFEEVAKTRL